MTPAPLGESLRAALGSPVTVGELPSSPRSRVWLVEFDGAPAVVKQIADRPDAGRRFAREQTALRLAGRASPPVVPAVLASDPGERVLVLEYLIERRPRRAWMSDYAAALARLHACGGPADAGLLPAWAGPGPGDIEAFTALAGRLGVPVPPGLAGEGLAGDHPALACLAQVSAAMRDRIRQAWPGTPGLPEARGNPLLVWTGSG
jgi:hypothetical protein